MDKYNNVLHGNRAKATRNVVPRFTNYVGNEPAIDALNRSATGIAEGASATLYNRLGDDAEFCKKQVDDKKL
jgi:hypothetical protein